MDLAVYAPPEALIARLHVLDQLRSEHSLRAVILRSSEPAAFAAVRERELEVWWLAPGLWGEVEPPRERRAVFPVVPGWSEDPPEAFEAQWPAMFCPTDPDLLLELASTYAQTANELEATGVYCTHMRYHHPADVMQLWGCVCSRCRSEMKRYGVSVQEVEHFWLRLADALRSMPVKSWATIAQPRTDVHPVVAWWASLTDSDVPVRWFAWKNATLQRLLATLARAFRTTLPHKFFVSNSFEPYWATLVGHTPETLESSDWYSPLLGYWPNHVHQSALNLAVWHARLGNEKDVELVLAALESILNGKEILHKHNDAVFRELQMGSKIATDVNLPYWPVLNGTSKNTVPLGQSMELAREVGASGVVLQGISQMLGDSRLDSWY